MLPVLVVPSPRPRRHFGAAAGGVHPIITPVSAHGPLDGEAILFSTVLEAELLQPALPSWEENGPREAVPVSSSAGRTPSSGQLKKRATGLGTSRRPH